VDLVLAVCLRPPNRAEAGVAGEGVEHEEAEEPVTLSLSMVEVEVEPTRTCGDHTSAWSEAKRQNACIAMLTVKLAVIVFYIS